MTTLHTLIKEGLAWLRRASAERRIYRDEEELVMGEGGGLWADRNPVPPWKWKEDTNGHRKFFK